MEEVVARLEFVASRLEEAEVKREFMLFVAEHRQRDHFQFNALSIILTPVLYTHDSQDCPS